MDYIIIGLDIKKEKIDNLIDAKNEREWANFQFNKASLIEKNE